jgi:Putative Actinobacterial Holin-X, holin superfamily III
VLSHFQVPVTWTELLKRTAREIQNDNGVGLAAELAYYFFLAAVAAIVAVILLATTVAWGISEGLGWPAWGGFAIVAVLMIVIAAALAHVGGRRYSAPAAMPFTVDTLKENAKWIRARTS